MHIRRGFEWDDKGDAQIVELEKTISRAIYLQKSLVQKSPARSFFRLQSDKIMDRGAVKEVCTMPPNDCAIVWVLLP
jgi:hypothetical protein